MADNNEIKALIDDWLTYVERKKIKEPEDTHLADFLQRKGFDPSIFQPLITKLPEKESSNETDELEKQLNVNLSKNQVNKLNRIKAVIKDDMNDSQRKALRRELKYG